MRNISRTHDFQHVKLTLGYPNQLSYTDKFSFNNLFNINYTILKIR